MNICFFCGGFNTNGGIGRATSILAENLSDYSDITVTLCSFYENRTGSYYYINKCEKTVVLYDSPITMQRAMLNQHAVKKLINCIKENNINVLIACGALYFPMAVLAARKCKIKLICWEHISPTVDTDYKFQKQARFFGAKFCDYNVVLTKEAEDWYKQHLKKNNIVQIYNPVDPDIFSSSGANYNNRSTKIISVGRLSYQKNFDRLIDIGKEILLKNPEWAWDIYGEGEEHQNLEDKIKSLGLSNRIYLKGQVQDMYKVYPNYAFIVMTSRYEGFPMVLLEAAAFGLPMISFDISTGPKEIIKSGTNGFLCSPDKNDDIIACIEELIAHQDLRIKMSEESRKVVNDFSMKKICNEWRLLLKKAVEE